MSRPRKLTLCLAVVALSVLITPFSRDLFVGDETKYGEVIRETRAAHAFFVPLLGGTPFTHKPPLHFWIVDLLSFPLGIDSTWAFVLPSLVAFLGLIVLMRRIGRELFDDESGGLAAFIAASSALIWASGQSARMDVEFTLVTTAAVLYLWRFLARDDFRALNLAALLAAVATLIKGPMSSIIVLALFIIEAIRRRRLPRGNYVTPVLITVAVPMLWVVPAVIIGGRAFADAILVKQTVGRAISTWVHKAPPWYYVARAPGTLFPWFFLVVVALVVLWRGESERRQAVRFCASWLAAVVIPYSLMSSKLDIYMMAAIPPAALLAGAFAARVRGSRWGVAANVVTLVLLGVAGAVGIVRGAQLVKGPEAALLQETMVKGWLGAMTALALLAIVLLLVSRDRLFDATLLAGMTFVVSLALLAALLMPRLNDLGSTRPLIASLQRQQVPGERIALYWTPQLWSRDYPPALERVRYVGPDLGAAGGPLPDVVATARSHTGELAPLLPHYRKVDEVRMIGKWFDVYRRND